MKTMNTWISGHEFEGIQDGQRVRMDGDVMTGFSPKALLLAGLGACTGIDVVDILEKMRIRFSGLVVETETEQTEDYPKVFKEILITYHIRTDPSNEDKVRKAIDLSLNKYCGVATMLKKNSPIRYELIIET